MLIILLKTVNFIKKYHTVLFNDRRGAFSHFIRLASHLFLYKYKIKLQERMELLRAATMYI